MESEENLVSPTKFLDVKLLIRLLLTLSFLIGCSDTVNSGPASISGDFEETPLVTVEIPDNAVDYTGQTEVVISIEDNVFHDRVITVSAGTKVTWVNNGRNRHNVMPSLEYATKIQPSRRSEKHTGKIAITAVRSGVTYICAK